MIGPGPFGIIAAMGGGVTAKPLTKTSTTTASATSGPFSTSNYWSSSTSSEFGTQQTFVILWYADDEAVSDERLCGFGEIGQTGGWSMRCYSTTGSIGPAYGFMRMNFFGGSGEMNAWVRYRKGLNCVAVTRTSGGALRISSNGVRAVQVNSSPTYVNAAGSPSMLIGRAHHNSNPATNQRVIAMASIAAEMSDADMKAATNCINEDERHFFNSTVLSHANLTWDVHFGDDWNGTDSTAVANGITFTGNGTIAQTVIPAEDLYALEAAHIGNSKTVTDETNFWGTKIAWPTVRLQTDATSIAVDLWMRDAGGLNWQELGCFEDGTWKTFNLTSADMDASDEKPATLELFGLTSGTKEVTLMVGSASNNAGGHGQATFYGKQFRVPTGASVAVWLPSAPADKVVCMGDSITWGQDTTPITENAWALQLRESYPAGSVTIDAYGSRTLANYSGGVGLTNLAQDVAALMDGTNSNKLVFAVGTVDYSTGESHSDWETWLGTFLDALRVEVPAVEVVILTPTKRLSPASEAANAAGSTLQDFRDSGVTVASTRAWVTTVDGAATAPDAGDYDSDGYHHSNQGGGKVYTAVAAALAS